MSVQSRIPAVLLAVCFGGVIPATGAESLQLTLPPQIYAVEGVPAGIWFDNLVVTQTPDQLQFDVRCDVGNTDQQHWMLTPTRDQVGRYTLTVTVSGDQGQSTENAATELIVLPSAAASDSQVRLLIVGDSLTHATRYPNELARLLNQPGNPQYTMLGTHRPGNALEGVAHEGYGGWTWGRFATHHEPNPDGTYKKRSSPFVFLKDDGNPELNVERYLQENCSGGPPDVVVFVLGINDCFGADPENPDPRIDSMLEHTETLLQAFHQAAPQSKLAIGITTPPNSRQSAFRNNYGDRYSRWGWKRIQHRLVQRLLQRCATPDSATGPLAVVPLHLNLDPVDGYPVDNSVHPNDVGYRQMGASLYAWLKWQLSQDSP